MHYHSIHKLLYEDSFLTDKNNSFIKYVLSIN